MMGLVTSTASLVRRRCAGVAALAVVALMAGAGAAQAQWATRGHIAPKLSSSGQGENEAAEEFVPIPKPRPKRPAPAAAPAAKPRKPAPIVSIGRRGPICERADIFGEPLASIADHGGCAIAAPVRFDRVAGVSIAPRAVSGCRVPQALSDWLAKHVQPAAQTLLGAKVARLHQVSAYVCRSRNGAPGAKLSFHATGDAFDIAAFELTDGRRVSVLEDWSGEGPMGAPGAAFLHKVWGGACSVFGTVLGPEADAAHRDHFHLDVARRRTSFCQ